MVRAPDSNASVLDYMGDFSEEARAVALPASCVCPAFVGERRGMPRACSEEQAVAMNSQ